MQRDRIHRRRTIFPNRPCGLIVAIALLSLVAGSGCMRRRMTIRSNPAGARVFVDKREIGVTPVSTSFTYYATREITLTRDGYETLTVLHDFKTPWYEHPPLDFFTENLIPNEYRDERVLDFQLIPQQNVRAQTIVDRAEQLRIQAGHGQAILPPGP